jgi:hypothetical protein
VSTLVNNGKEMFTIKSQPQIYSFPADINDGNDNDVKVVKSSKFKKPPTFDNFGNDKVKSEASRFYRKSQVLNKKLDASK